MAPLKTNSSSFTFPTYEQLSNSPEQPTGTRESIARAMTERALFLIEQQRRAETVPTPEPNLEPQVPLVSSEQAKQIVTDLLPQINRQYSWLKDTDSSTIAQLLSDVEEFRRDYHQSHETPPSDAQVYRHYRLQLETDTDTPDAAYENVVILEALMNGDITKGQLPVVLTEVA